MTAIALKRLPLSAARLGPRTGRSRALLALELLGVTDDRLRQPDSRARAVAGRNWKARVRRARNASDPAAEADVNLLWQACKNWFCQICGRLKWREADRTCSPSCRLARNKLNQGGDRQQVVQRLAGAGLGSKRISRLVRRSESWTHRLLHGPQPRFTKPTNDLR